MPTKAHAGASKLREIPSPRDAPGGLGLSSDQFQVLSERMTAIVQQLRAPAELPSTTVEALVARAAKEALVVRDKRLHHVLDAQERLQGQLEQVTAQLEQQSRLLVALLQSQPVSADHRAMRDYLAHTHAEGLSDLVLLQRPVGQHAAKISGSTASLAPGAASLEASGQWHAHVMQGEARRARWVADGLLVPGVALAKAWHRSRQALDQACLRGELFAIKVGKDKYYPADFLVLEAEAVKRVNLALKGDNSVAKFVFWRKKHGGLADKTIAEALNDAGHLVRAVELATGWSEEHGFAADASAA